VIPSSMQRCFRSFWISIWSASTMVLVIRSALTVESPLVWLVDASGVADREAFAGLERFAFEDDLRTLWNGSGILVPS